MFPPLPPSTTLISSGNIIPTQQTLINPLIPTQQTLMNPMTPFASIPSMPFTPMLQNSNAYIAQSSNIMYSSPPMPSRVAIPGFAFP